MKSDFIEKLVSIQKNKQSILCIGLDPDLDRLPARCLRGHTPVAAIRKFNQAIIEATAPQTCAYKINFAFYEVFGADGWNLLKETVDLIPTDTLIVADGKRGDIGNSARFYAESVFRTLGFDACTVSPYMGADSVAPFLNYPGACTFILCRTSNPGGSDFQELETEGVPLFERVAEAAAVWSRGKPGTAGLVVGATSAGALTRLHALSPTLPLLIPGVGAQGGEIETVRLLGATHEGGVLVNSSRQILYASNHDDFADAACIEAEKLRRMLQPDIGRL